MALFRYVLGVVIFSNFIDTFYLFRKICTFEVTQIYLCSNAKRGENKIELEVD